MLGTVKAPVQQQKMVAEAGYVTNHVTKALPAVPKVS
jgi:hypothetical protein